MLTEESKKRIEAMSVSEIAYEIELGTRSRFQREKMAYLKKLHKERMHENAVASPKHSFKHSIHRALMDTPAIAYKSLIGIVIGGVITALAVKLSGLF